MVFKQRLRTAGVSLVDPHRPLLRCDRCGRRWPPTVLSGGRLPRGYWKCPGGCNSGDIPEIGYRAPRG